MIFLYSSFNVVWACVIYTHKTLEETMLNTALHLKLYRLSGIITVPYSLVCCCSFFGTLGITEGRNHAFYEWYLSGSCLDFLFDVSSD